MTASQRTENVTAVVVLLCTAAMMLRPDWAWLNWATPGALLGGLVLALWLRTPSDHDRARRGAWIIPAIALAIALQWVYFADEAGRLRAVLLGGALVLAATALAWVRRQ